MIAAVYIMDPAATAMVTAIIKAVAAAKTTGVATVGRRSVDGRFT